MLGTGSNTVDSTCLLSSSPTAAMWLSPSLPHLIPAQILPRILDPSPTTSPSFTLRSEWTSKMQIRSRSSLKPPLLRSEDRIQVSDLNSIIRHVAPTHRYISKNCLPCNPSLTSLDFPISSTCHGAAPLQGLPRLFPWRWHPLTDLNLLAHHSYTVSTTHTGAIFI